MGHAGNPCRVLPRQLDPQTGPMCGTCIHTDLEYCGHSPYYNSDYDKAPALCGLGKFISLDKKTKQHFIIDYWVRINK